MKFKLSQKLQMYYFSGLNFIFKCSFNGSKRQIMIQNKQLLSRFIWLNGTQWLDFTTHTNNCLNTPLGTIFKFIFARNENFESSKSKNQISTALTDWYEYEFNVYNNMLTLIY